MTTDPQRRFGSHLSVAGGLENAIGEALRLQCDCVQIFVKNQRRWRAAKLSDDAVMRFKDAVRAAPSLGVHPIVAHASYLLNLASPDSETRTRSIEAMIDEVERCEALGVSSLVFHPGAHRTGTLEEGIAHVATSLDEVHQACPGFRTTILLESTAGQGSAIGWQFSQLAAILDRVSEPDRLGVCLDTCHLFAAGYDIRTAGAYATTMDELHRTVGSDRVKCIHVNDSKRELASRVDRHEHIGKGRIGKPAFAHLINDPRFFGVPMILETPKGKDGRGVDFDKTNLRRLRAMISVPGR